MVCTQSRFWLWPTWFYFLHIYYFTTQLWCRSPYLSKRDRHPVVSMLDDFTGTHGEKKKRKFPSHYFNRALCWPSQRGSSLCSELSFTGHGGNWKWLAKAKRKVMKPFALWCHHQCIRPYCSGTEQMSNYCYCVLWETFYLEMSDNLTARALIMDEIRVGQATPYLLTNLLVLFLCDFLLERHKKEIDVKKNTQL